MIPAAVIDYNAMIPASYPEVVFWMLLRRSALLCGREREPDAGTLALPRRDDGRRILRRVTADVMRRLRAEGWRDFGTHILPPDGWREAMTSMAAR